MAAIALHCDRVVDHQGTGRGGRRASVEARHGFLLGFFRYREVFQSIGCGNESGITGHGNVLRARCVVFL